MGKKSRNTRQKDIILDEINKTGSFFTAEQLHNKLMKKGGKIGIATVYRFLREFKSQKKIHHYICDRKNIYSCETKNHSHFICEKCRKTEHFSLKSVDFFKKEIKGNICHFQLDVYGTCEKCLDKN